MLSRCPRYAPRVINVVFHKIVEQRLSYRTICRRNPGIIFEILSLVVSAPVPIVIQPGGNIGVRQAGVVHILINRWGPVFRAVPSPHIFLHVRYHKNSLFNPKTYGNMRLIRSILTRYCIRKKAFNAKLRQKLNNFFAGAVICPIIRDRDNGVPWPQHLQKSGCQGVPVPMVGQLYEGAGRELVPLPAGGIHIPRQLNLLPGIG